MKHWEKRLRDDLYLDEKYQYVKISPLKLRICKKRVCYYATICFYTIKVILKAAQKCVMQKLYARLPTCNLNLILNCPSFNFAYNIKKLCLHCAKNSEEQKSCRLNTRGLFTDSPFYMPSQTLALNSNFRLTKVA